MKALSIAAAGISVAFIVLTLVPSAGDFRPGFSIGALICSAVALITIVLGWRERSATALVARASQQLPEAPTRTDTVATNVARPVVATSVAIPAVGASPPPGIARETRVENESSEAAVVRFLATLQEKGRLVDFLQDDIAGYSDAQVGAAARVVHQGCRAVLSEHISIVPVCAQNEGSRVDVPAGYVADEYRLVGKITGQAPFSGTLMHRGWKANSVNLPRVLRSADDRIPVIAPAEVELR